MNHNMQPFSRMPLGAMGMSLGGPPNAPPVEAINHPRPALAAGGNAKKKRRTTAKAPRSQPLPCPVTQDLHLPVENQPTYARPPQLSGYGDTVIASNPFDDMPSRSAQTAMMQSGSLLMHAHKQHMGVPRMRGMNPMSSLNEMNPMMGHNMGPMNPLGGPMNPMDRISPMNMGAGQPPGPMSSMSNPMSRMSPMNMGQPSPMGMMGNPMGCDKPMNSMGPNAPPGNPMSAINNRASPMNMGSSNMGSHQPTGPLNMMNPMGRMNPMKSAGPNQPPGPMGMGNMGTGQASGPQMGNMGRQMGSPMGNIPGGNQNYMDNGPVNMGGMESNLPNHPNGSLPISNMGNAERFGPNPSHSYPNNMGMQMNPGNVGRMLNDPMNTMSMSNGVNNANMGGPPINSGLSDMNIAQRNQMGQIMGGPVGGGSGPGNMFGALPTRHPMNMGGGNMPPQGLFQARPAMGPRIMGPTNGKVYPADQHIIFNSQNRNAPPIYLCGSCHKEVNDNDQGIVCESGCNFWFHRSCVGLSEAAFHMLTQAPYAEWACDNCNKVKKIPPIKFTT